MWRPIWCLNWWGSRVCVFLKQQRRHSFQAFCLLLLCSSPPRKEVCPGFFWSVVVVVDVFFASVWRWVLWNSMSWTHGLEFWSACWNGLLLQLWLVGIVGFGLSTYLASFFGGFLLPLLAFCVLSLSLVFCTLFLTQETHLLYFRGLGLGVGGLGLCCSSCVFLEMGFFLCGKNCWGLILYGCGIGERHGRITRGRVRWGLQKGGLLWHLPIWGSTTRASQSESPLPICYWFVHLLFWSFFFFGLPNLQTSKASNQECTLCFYPHAENLRPIHGMHFVSLKN